MASRQQPRALGAPTIRVWLLNPYGPIPGEGWRDYRFTLMARALAERGHEVTWFTATFAHQSKQQRAAGWERREVSERFAIELVPTPSYRRNIGVARLWFEQLFARRVNKRGRALSHPDVILAADPPQFCGAAGRRLARHHHAFFVTDCFDLWPELFVAAAPYSLRFLVNAAVAPLRKLRRRNLRATSLAIAVAETYRRVLEREGARRTVTIPIGIDVNAFAPHEKRARDHVALVYAGSLGEHYDLDTLLDVLATMPKVRLTIAGRGPAEERLRRRSASLPNVFFAGAVGVEKLSELYAASDVGLAPYQAGSTVALPTKLFDYLAAGLPVITSLDSEVSTLIEDAHAGVRYKAGDAASLRAAIVALSDPSRRGPMATAARELAMRFDARPLYAQFADAIEALVRS
ncbi:MAG TPA: glycosyltransferase family 4 protein [Thermoanaerobaculia bacterium]|nr:glycosyltransferase family 4 protein [Thermoanaerobaculia bacterium]